MIEAIQALELLLMRIEACEHLMGRECTSSEIKELTADLLVQEHEKIASGFDMMTNKEITEVGRFLDDS